MLNALLAFVEGLGLILSPCILPILPIVLASSLDGGRRRPLGIICGFIGAFTAFAIVSRQVLSWANVDPNLVRNVALVFLALFGGMMLSRTLSDGLIRVTQGLANFGESVSSRWNNKSGFISGVGLGCLIGLIWTPCAGPIMAAAVVQIIQAQTSSLAAFTIIMFALGAGLPMLLIALAGRQIMTRLSFLKAHSYAVRRVLGAVIIAAAMLIFFGADVEFLAGKPTSVGDAPATTSTGVLRDQLAQPYAAPDFIGGDAWLNSPPLKIADLRGKVVLVDFWTYSCINCVRTLPYLTDWDAKYRDKGLVIVGVHAPEFEFEKKQANVEQAIAKHVLHYPIVLDNDLAIWNLYHNRYWPAHYLIDKNGQVVYTHFGEGDYGITENNIRVLLGLDKKPEALFSGESPIQNLGLTPETYLGYGRAENYSGKNEVHEDVDASYDFAADLPRAHWSLRGQWNVAGEKITAMKDGAKLRLHFKATKVFLVMGTADGKPKQVDLMLDGKLLVEKAGGDAPQGSVTIVSHALYELVHQKSSDAATLELTAKTAGVELYAFTFGND